MDGASRAGVAGVHRWVLGTRLLVVHETPASCLRMTFVRGIVLSIWSHGCCVPVTAVKALKSAQAVRSPNSSTFVSSQDSMPWGILLAGRALASFDLPERIAAAVHAADRASPMHKHESPWAVRGAWPGAMDPVGNRCERVGGRMLYPMR